MKCVCVCAHVASIQVCRTDGDWHSEVCVCGRETKMQWVCPALNEFFFAIIFIWHNQITVPQTHNTHAQRVTCWKIWCRWSIIWVNKNCSYSCIWLYSSFCNISHQVSMCKHFTSFSLCSFALFTSSCSFFISVSLPPWGALWDVVSWVKVITTESNPITKTAPVCLFPKDQNVDWNNFSWTSAVRRQLDRCRSSVCLAQIKNSTSVYSCYTLILYSF